MTETTEDGPQSVRRDGHLGELKLRRLFAGESLGPTHDAEAAHVSRCLECTRRMEALAEEQRAFEARVSFDRFAAGVERATRVPRAAAEAGAGQADGEPPRTDAAGRDLQASRPAPSSGRRPASTRSFLTIMSAGAIAACLALVAGVRPLFQQARERQARESAELATSNRLKGATPASVTFRIAPPPPDEGPQRTAAADGPELLAVGERIRVGVQAGGHRYLFAISVDDKGTVTPLYPESGTSMPLPAGSRMHYLPDSLELTGRGTERLVVLLTDQRFELDTIRRSVAVAFQKAGGDLSRLPNLAIPGQQFHRLFLKP